ncbi:S8 family serine peptidase [Solibacillus sp. CAU 1738]|uniref:S8 family peptidase n=1 Tax=Solibacillus sp. CAU 1738 TaxID=3140363 RepID=UPI003261C38E
MAIHVMIKLKYSTESREIEKSIKELSDNVMSFNYDDSYSWVSKSPAEVRIPIEGFPFTTETTFEQQKGHILIRGKLDTREWKLVESFNFVEKVFRDSNIQFSSSKNNIQYFRDTNKLNIDTIRRELKIHKLWKKKLYGKNIVVGVVDSGIEINSTRREYPSFPQVIGGYPANNFGTKSLWDCHGNMVAYDILTMAPKVKLLDIRVAEHINSSKLSDIAKAYSWVETNFIKHGTPHILNNSWALYNHMSDLSFAHNINHPVTEWVAKLVSLGISIVFSAGNCGCSSDSRCGNSYGYNSSIWGANSHPSVITVGAVRYLKPNDFIIENYSSVGNGSLSPHKPDLVCYSNIKLRGKTHTGTSVSAPFVSGILALLYQKDPNIDPFTLKDLLINNCTRSLPYFSKSYGHGLINPFEVEKYI